MKIVSYISSIKAGKRYNGGNPITAALESIVSAANNSGGEFTAYKHEGTHTVSCDVGFAFGSYTQRKLDTERAVLIRGIEAAKQPCYFLDSAAFSTHIRNALNSSETQMFRVGLNSCTGQGIFWNQDLPKERYEAFKKQFNFCDGPPQDNKDGPIVFLAQTETGWQFDDLEPYHKFANRTLKQIREITERKIIYRTHPKLDPRSPLKKCIEGIENLEVHNCPVSRRTLFESLNGAYACVTHSSSGALEAVTEGIPTFALSKRAFGSPMYLTDIKDINNAFQFFEWDKRHQWLYNLAYTSWSIEELKTIEVLRYYTNMLKGQNNED
jgi:hypothetical protein|tara:strand:+ start:1780 stop:2754 length:975 start_codon:yes stop_codon:yes gene_type:complete